MCYLMQLGGGTSWTLVANLKRRRRKYKLGTEKGEDKDIVLSVK